MIIGGWAPEALRFLTGAPSVPYNLTSYTASEAWDLMRSADFSNVIITATSYSDSSDDSFNEVGLPYDHAYTVLSAIEIYNATGDLFVNLLQMRNPWGNDQQYYGLWNDGDAIWNADGETYQT